MLISSFFLTACGGSSDDVTTTGLQNMPVNSQNLPAIEARLLDEFGNFDFEGTWAGSALGRQFMFDINQDSLSQAQNLIGDCDANLNILSASGGTLALEVEVLNGECAQAQDAVVVLRPITANQISYGLFEPGTDYFAVAPVIEGILERQ